MRDVYGRHIVGVQSGNRFTVVHDGKRILSIHYGSERERLIPVAEPLRAAFAVLDRRARGEDVKLDAAVLDWDGFTEAQRAVMRALMRLPRGRVVSYGTLAAMAGMPRAQRFVGSVMSGNPFPLALPCHRVVRADGRPGEYGGDTPLKIRLLEAEGVLFARGRILKEFFFAE